MSEIITRYVDVTFDGTYKKMVEGVFQYDHGLKLRVRGVPTNVAWQMQFGNRAGNETVTSIATVSGDAVIGDIPDALLEQQREVVCYMYYEDPNYGITVYEIYFPLMPRLKPAAGSYTPEQIEAYDALVAELQELISEVRNGEYMSALIEFANGYLHETETQITNLTVHDGYRYAADGSLVANTPSIGTSQAVEIPVTAYQEIRWKCYYANRNASYNVKYLMDDNTIVEDTNYTTSGNEYTFTVPTNCVKLLVSCWVIPDVGNTFYLITVGGSPVKDDVDELRDDVDQLREEFDAVSDGLITTTWTETNDYTSYSGYRYASDGTLVANTPTVGTSVAVEMDVDGGEKIKWVCYYANRNTTYSVRYKMSDNSVVEDTNYTTDGDEYIFTVPNNCVKLLITCWVINGNNHFYLATATNIQSAKGYVDSRLNDMADGLPAYYHENNYWGGVIDKVREKSKILHGISFIFATDMHYPGNQLKSKLMMKDILNKTTVPFVICGGDIPAAYGTATELKASGEQHVEYENFIGKDKFFTVRGNHDFTIKTNSSMTTGAPNTGATLPIEYPYDYLMRTQERFVAKQSPDHMCWYIDVPAQKVRIVGVNSCDGQTSDTTASWGLYTRVTDAQLSWIINEACSEDGYNYIFVSHIPSDTALDVNAAVLAPYQNLLLAMKNKTTYSSGSVTADFTNSTSTIVCHITGHEHVDQTHVDNNLLAIGVTCDTIDTLDGFNARAGTITEQAFDVFCIDFDSKTINAVRAGRGNDRNWTYV